MTPDVQPANMIEACPQASVAAATASELVADIQPRAPFVEGQGCPGLLPELAIRLEHQRLSPKIARGLARTLRESLEMACAVCPHFDGDVTKRSRNVMLEIAATKQSLRSRGLSSVIYDEAGKRSRKPHKRRA